MAQGRGTAAGTGAGGGSGGGTDSTGRHTAITGGGPRVGAHAAGAARPAVHRESAKARREAAPRTPAGLHEELSRIAKLNHSMRQLERRDYGKPQNATFRASQEFFQAVEHVKEKYGVKYYSKLRKKYHMD